jgi:hypothetical protein
MAKIQVLNATVHTKKLLKSVCCNCGKKLNIGDRYVSVVNSGHGLRAVKWRISSARRYRMYCVDCAEEKNII